jgi:hypothetical protein
MFNFIYARASRFTIVRENGPSVSPVSPASPVSPPVSPEVRVCPRLMHFSLLSCRLSFVPLTYVPARQLQPAHSLEPTPAQPPVIMARIPVDLYRPILEHFASAQSASRAELLALLTVSKAMSREVQRLLYNSLVLTADKPKPTFTDATYLLVRKLKIVVGNRSREAEHMRRCEAILPRLVRLESLEIRGRGWNMDALERCLPLPGSGHGIASLRSLALDASLTVPVARFIAAQPKLQELDLVSGMATTVLPEALAALPPTLPALTKLNTCNTICTHLLPLAPGLKHVKLAFDLSETLQDVISTIESLPLSIVSVFFHTTRKDLTPALAALPRTLKNLSTVLVPDQQEPLLDHLGALSCLEQIVLNVHQPAPSLINPWSSPAASSSSASSTPSASPSLSSMALPVSPSSSPKSSPRPRPIALGPDHPPMTREQLSEGHPNEDEEREQEQEREEEVDPLVVALKSRRPTLIAIYLDERTYARRRRSWVSTSTSTDSTGGNGEWGRVHDVDTSKFKTSSRANELEVWEGLH